MEAIKNIFLDPYLGTKVDLLLDDERNITLRIKRDNHEQTHKLGNLKDGVEKILSEEGDAPGRREITAMQYIREITGLGLADGRKFFNSLIWKPFYFESSNWEGEVKSLTAWKSVVEAFDGEIDVLMYARAVPGSGSGDGTIIFGFSEKCVSNQNLGEWGDKNHMHLRVF